MFCPCFRIQYMNKDCSNVTFVARKAMDSPTIVARVELISIPLRAAMPLIVIHHSHHHQLQLTFSPPYQSRCFCCDVCRDLGPSSGFTGSAHVGLMLICHVAEPSLDFLQYSPMWVWTSQCQLDWWLSLRWLTWPILIMQTKVGFVLLSQPICYLVTGTWTWTWTRHFFREY